jgi:DNA polymerase-4
MGVGTIIHVDMNAYFASVEALACPGLVGLPFAVAPAGRRSIVLTASYEARARGVKTGQSTYEALERCPDLKLVAPDYAKYTDLCEQLFRMYREYTSQVEIASIDEVFLDVSSVLSGWPGPRELARAIQDRVRRDFRLPCSLGIAPNKLLAKLASDLMKPQGLVEISADNPPLFVLECLPVDELCGIGPRTKAALAVLGVRTLGDLGRAPRALLEGRFGSQADRLRRLARGLDDREVVPPESLPEARSLSHAMTLERNTSDRAQMARHLLGLSCRVAERLRRRGWKARTVRLTLRTSDFRTFGRQKTLEGGLDTAHEIHQVVLGILGEVRLERPIRLLGVAVSGFSPEGLEESVFPGDRARHRLAHAVDEVNERWGESAVTYAALLGTRSRASNPIPWGGRAESLSGRD